ncbi:type VI secretion system protein TssA [Lysobacter sp. GX 14042]|uniref:type VI secretion system protein TssA n=1 Tax=Lysobacter sp. GX 14042 TaxID=2907155 RepID=UPI001F1D3AA3|nr:type VI secretion system protein TssA [Lysobacter sp. GX 14042]MCE7032185.1 type VI secretion system protein TssA [Lysobacter sp. GX 14042]
MQELDALLEPVAGPGPGGEDLSFSPEYDAIAEARRADDPSLEQGEWITDLKQSDWPAVERQAGELLRTRSKDLRLAGWWAEAQARNHGFTGLARGYRLVAGLCERYWDALYPLAEDGDAEPRIGNLAWLITHSARWLRELPLVQSPRGSYGLAEIEAAAARGAEAEGPDSATIDAARRDTPHEFYVRLVERLDECAEALAAMEAAVDFRLGMDGPGFGALRDTLDGVRTAGRRFAREAGVLLDGAAPTVESFAGDSTADIAPPAEAAPVGPIASRREAIARLREVAEYFRRTEPHSPVAYLAEKAAHWGEMPLHVWLRRVVRDHGTLEQLEDLLDSAEPATGD